MGLAVAVIAIIIAADPESKVLGLVSYAWAGFGAAFGPVVILSVFWKRMTAAGALAGMIAGAVTVVAWKATGSSLYEIVPGFIACAVAVVVVSLLDKVPAGVVKNFEEADKTYHAAK